MRTEPLHSRTEAGPGQPKPPHFGRTVLDDLHQADLPRTLREDFRDIYDFYLDPETRRELSQMDQGQRWFHLTGWVLKSSVLKLSPNRRLMLLAAALFLVLGIIGYPPGLWIAIIVLLLILMLELKDKLLAQDELEAGRAVQFALLPSKHPRLPGWETWLFTRPANEVGGDLVDYLPLDDRRLGLAVGDVAGKGLGAALVMAKLQATLRALAPDQQTLDGLGRRVNEIFCRDGLPNRFVSLAYLVLEAGSGHVRLLNAGHLPPLIVRRTSLEEPTKGGAAIGLHGTACYTEQAMDLAPGDLLVVYSDGLTEARNEAGAFFGDERLRLMLPHLRDLPVAEAGRLLLAEVERFVGEARPHDDLSLLLLKRVESDPAPLPVNGSARPAAPHRAP